jgi:hypothetical protein
MKNTKNFKKFELTEVQTRKITGGEECLTGGGFVTKGGTQYSFSNDWRTPTSTSYSAKDEFSGICCD